MPLRYKVSFSLSRFFLLPLSGEVLWFGKRFRSDNKIGLFLLPGYLAEVSLLIGNLSISNSSNEKIRVLDVGANVGQFAVTLLNVCPNIEIVSFEPNPVVFPLLESNSKLYKDSILTVNVGIGADNLTEKLHFVKSKSAQGSIIATNSDKNLLSAASRVTEVEIPIRKLSKILNDVYDLTDVSQFNLLKIDVEGYEESVLIGSEGVEFKYLWIELHEDSSLNLNRINTILGAFSIFTSVSPALNDDSSQIHFSHNYLFQACRVE